MNAALGARFAAGAFFAAALVAGFFGAAFVAGFFGAAFLAGAFFAAAFLAGAFFAVAICLCSIGYDVEPAAVEVWLTLE